MTMSIIEMKKTLKQLRLSGALATLETLHLLTYAAIRCSFADTLGHIAQQ